MISLVEPIIQDTQNHCLFKFPPSKEIAPSLGHHGFWYSAHQVFTNLKSWLVHKQTAFGKDKSNPLMVDSLPKTIWLLTNHT